MALPFPSYSCLFPSRQIHSRVSFCNVSSFASIPRRIIISHLDLFSSTNIVISFDILCLSIFILVRYSSSLDKTFPLHRGFLESKFISFRSICEIFGYHCFSIVSAALVNQGISATLKLISHRISPRRSVQQNLQGFD